MLKKINRPLSKIFRSPLDWISYSPGRAFVFIFALAFGIRASGNELYILPSPEREWERSPEHC